MKDPVVPYFSAIAAFLSLFTLVWHLPSRNWAMIWAIIWIFCANGIQAINSFIWYSNIDNSAPVWCDICESNPDVPLDHYPY